MAVIVCCIRASCGAIVICVITVIRAFVLYTSDVTYGRVILEVNTDFMGL
jgi:hypothetical protein